MHSICNLKYNLKYFIMDLIMIIILSYGLAEKFKKQFTCMEKTLPKIHRTYYNLLIGKDSW